MLPSMIQAVAVSGRSVYRTLGKGLYHCGLTIDSATLSWLMAMDPALIFPSFCRSSSSIFWSTWFSI